MTLTEEQRGALARAIDYINETDLPVGELDGFDREVLRSMVTTAINYGPDVMKMIELLAAGEHDQWADWAQSILDSEPGLSDGRKAAWPEMIATPYENLSEELKDKDRREVYLRSGDALAEIERLRAENLELQVAVFGPDGIRANQACIIADQAARISDLEIEITGLKADLEQSEEIKRLKDELENYGDHYACLLISKDAQIKELEGMLSIRTEELDIAHSVARSEKEMHEKELAAFARRIKELEEALVEMVATNPCNIPTLCDVVHDELMCPALDGNCDFWKGCPQKNELREAARKQLQAEGKIGPDAKSVNKGNQCQYCKKCGRDMRFEFSIRDEIWNKLPKTWKDRVLCIECFLEELNEVEPDQEIHFDDFNYMCILDPIEDTEWKGDRPKLLHPLFGGTLIDAKNPLAWQITEERVGLLEYCLETLLDAPDIEEIPGPGHSIEVLRVMLGEAGQE